MIEGKIYCITFLEDNSKYVGSTVKQYLSQRAGNHKHNSPSKNGFIPTITERMNNGEPYVYSLITEGIYFNEYDMLYWERIHTELTPNTINKNRCWTTPEEKKESKSKRDKTYREKHSERVKGYKNIKHKCECGGQYSNSTKQRHFRTEKHKNFMIKNNILV